MILYKNIFSHLSKLFFSIIILVISVSSHGQKFEKINRLESQLKEETEHDKLADIYYQLSDLYAYNNKDKALEKARKSLTISKSLQDRERLIKSYHQIGILETKIQNFETALEVLYEALRLSEETKDNNTVSLTYVYIGDVYKEKGEFETASDFYQKALNLGENSKCGFCTAKANSAFGILQHLKGNDNLSLQYHLQALENIHLENQRAEKAIIYYNIGTMYKLNKQSDVALDYFINSLAIYEALDDGEMQSILNYEIGIIYQNKNVNDKALIYLKNSLGWAEKTGLKAYIKKGYENISEVYEKDNDYEHAYEYLKYYDAIKDTREISELESQLELEKKNREIQLLNKERDFKIQQLNNEQVLKFIGFISLIIVVALAVFLSLALRQKNRINGQLQLANEDANRSRKEKEEFFAYTSHEIRTPLNAVIGMSNLLAETDLSPAQQGYLKTLKSSTQNILFLVNDVLDLSKIEAGSIELETVDFSLQNIIDEVIQSLTFKVRDKDVILTSDIDPDIPKVVKGDPIRINQVILNLADNALKFTSTGEVKITLKKRQETEKFISIFFAVTDTGIGIRKSRLSSIFDSFKQESSHTARQYGGTGLGLAISQKLIELMGGEINVDSTYGKGSTFYFELIFKKSKNSSLKIPVNEEKYVGLRDVHILVVDDNSLNREIFFDLINDQKNKVIVDLAEDGKMAISKIQDKNYDIVLMDLQMPRMDGYEATRIIRKMEGEKSKIPIVAMTAHVLEGVAEKCTEAGMNDSISKPINLKLLTQKINQYVSQEGLENIPEKNNTENSKFETTYVHLDTLYQLTNNNVDKIEKYINIFLNNVPNDLEKMKDALEQNDFGMVAAMAHKMKGNVGYMGIDSIKDDLLELEKLKEVVGELDEITDIVSKVEVVIDLAIRELKQITNKLK